MFRERTKEENKIINNFVRSKSELIKAKEFAMSEKCLICGDNKEHKNLGAHVWGAHKIKMDEYRKTYVAVPDESESDIEEVEQEIEPSDEGISYKDRVKSVFKDSEKFYTDKPMSTFLEDFEINEQELRDIVKQYKTGQPINVIQTVKKKEELAKKSAEELKDKDTVDVTDVHTAEELVKKYNFVVTEVRSRPVKTWVLVKK